MQRIAAHTRARGQMLLVAGAFIIGMSGVALLVFDGGTLYQDRLSTVQAADAAAQAATQNLVKRATDTQIRSSAESYARQLGAVYSSGSYTDANGTSMQSLGNSSAVPYDNWGARGVTITATRPGRTGFFLSLFGETWVNVNSSTTWVMRDAAQPAQFGNPPTGQWPSLNRGNALPLAVPLQALLNATQNSQFDIWNSQYDNSYPGLPSNFKGVWDPDSAALVSGSCTACSRPAATQQYATYGFDGVVGVPTSPLITNGLLGNNISDGVKANLEAQNLSDPTGRYGVFLISVYDAFDPVTGKIRLVGVVGMKIYLTDVTGSSAVGTFVNYLNLTGAAGVSSVAGLDLPEWMQTTVIRPIN